MSKSAYTDPNESSIIEEEICNLMPPPGPPPQIPMRFQGRRVRPTPIYASTKVIWLDFNPGTVTDPRYNSGNPMNLQTSGMTEANITAAYNMCEAHFSEYDVSFTTSVNVFNAAPGYKQRCIITSQSQFFPSGATGWANIGSLYNGTNYSCYVFSDQLSYVASYVGFICAHELGHTFGLYHQSDYNLSTCAYISAYRTGPTMGTAFGTPPGYWGYGPWSGGGCNSWQHDDLILQRNLGSKIV